MEADDELNAFEAENDGLLRQDSTEASRKEERFDSRIDSCSLTIEISEC